jgi:DNA (cytosine-5)-methyltransferase 1
MSRPKLLDLFCGAGGASAGYHRSGFRVTGVDVHSQPRYPYRFVRADALEYLAEHGEEYDVIHASPPCQRYTTASFRNAARSLHPDLIPDVRRALEASGKPWVVENVPGSPLRTPCVRLCGLMFSLTVFRHRLFESSCLLLAPPHPSHRGKRIGEGGFCCVIGHGGGASRRLRISSAAGQDRKSNWALAMGIDWMTRDELSQAIPPAYTEYLGRQLRLTLTRG